MRNRFTLTLSLLAILLAAACTQTPGTTPEKTDALAKPSATPPQFVPDVQSTEAAPTLPSETFTQPSQAVATSRGPNLEASDPASFNQASGNLQLVEFFAFW